MDNSREQGSRTYHAEMHEMQGQDLPNRKRSEPDRDMIREMMAALRTASRFARNLGNIELENICRDAYYQGRHRDLAWLEKQLRAAAPAPAPTPPPQPKPVAEPLTTAPNAYNAHNSHNSHNSNNAYDTDQTKASLTTLGSEGSSRSLSPADHSNRENREVQTQPQTFTNPLVGATSADVAATPESNESQSHTPKAPLSENAHRPAPVSRAAASSDKSRAKSQVKSSGTISSWQNPSVSRSSGLPSQEEVEQELALSPSSPEGEGNVGLGSEGAPTPAATRDPLADLVPTPIVEITCREDLEAVLSRHQAWKAAVLSSRLELSSGRANLCNVDLSGFDLTGVDLSCALLRGATLRGANLRSANLSGADLSSADLQGADLRNANLRRAKFVRADLREAELEGAKTEGTDFNWAKRPKGMDGAQEELNASAAELESEKSVASVDSVDTADSMGSIGSIKPKESKESLESKESVESPASAHTANSELSSPGSQ